MSTFCPDSPKTCLFYPIFAPDPQRDLRDATIRLISIRRPSCHVAGARGLAGGGLPGRWGRRAVSGWSAGFQARARIGPLSWGGGTPRIKMPVFSTVLSKTNLFQRGGESELAYAPSPGRWCLVRLSPCARALPHVANPGGLPSGGQCLPFPLLPRTRAHQRARKRSRTHGQAAPADSTVPAATPPSSGTRIRTPPC